MKLPPATDADFTRSLYTQKQRDPKVDAAATGVLTGGAGAVVGAALAKLLGAGMGGTLAGAGVGGGLAGLAGALSARNEAERANSKLLALRRLGINNLSELHALEAYPETSPSILKAKSRKALPSKSAVKEASRAQIAKGVAGGLAGLGGSALYGKYFFDDPTARKYLGLVDGITGATLAMSPSGRAEILKKSLYGHAIPIVQQAAATMSSGSQQLANTAAANSPAKMFRDVAGSGLAKGLGAGGGLAALAGVASGALRRRSIKEEREDKSRADMMLGDSKKFMLPGLAIGGLGSVLMSAHKNRSAT